MVFTRDHRYRGGGIAQGFLGARYRGDFDVHELLEAHALQFAQLIGRRIVRAARNRNQCAAKRDPWFRRQARSSLDRTDARILHSHTCAAYRGFSYERPLACQTTTAIVTTEYSVSILSPATDIARGVVRELRHAHHRDVKAFRTVRGRMLFWVLAVTVPIYAIALYMSYQATAQRLEAGAARDADELAARLAAGLDTVIRPIEGGIRTVAHQLEEVNPPPEQYPLRIRGILNAWPDVYGSTIATEVEPTRTCARPFAPYYFRRAGSIAYSDLALDSYGYSQLPWYRRAADAGRAVWSTPYFDAGGGETWMITYSVPFFRASAHGARQLAGVVTADLALDWVREAAARMRLEPFAAGWLASPPGPQDVRGAHRRIGRARRECHSRGRRSDARAGSHLRTGAEAIGRRGCVSRGAQPRDTAVAAHAGHAARTAAGGGERGAASPAVAGRRRIVVAGRRDLVRGHGRIPAYPPAGRSRRQRQGRRPGIPAAARRPGTTRSVC